MKIRSATCLLLLAPLAAGCSYVSLPSMPSFAWSSSEPKADASAEALFQEGMRYFKDKRYVRALDHFGKLKTDHPFSPQLTQAELMIADAYYLNQQYPEAINAFKEFESMHPRNENMPFVTYRLGMAHFNQFTSIDRDQKNTETAKTYFETVLAKYPKSTYAEDARDKLAKCNGYLAEHDFAIARFYLQQEKYPAARDRFEEIVRKYRGTAAAAKSLFFLGESYRNEKNHLKATLAYEALIQHYPESEFAAPARTQLARAEKEKQDPLALLLMRDRRPTLVASEDGDGNKTAKTKQPDNLVAKTEIVYEEPGAQKGLFRRVVDKINPFSSSETGATAAEKKSSESAIELLAKKKAAEKDPAPGVMARFWGSINPFGGAGAAADGNAAGQRGGNALIQRVDNSLKGRGVDTATQTAALKPPAADLPKVEEPVVQNSDTTALFRSIDATLSKDGRNIDQAPQPPKAADAFNQVASPPAVASRPAPSDPAATTGLLSDIDQKLRSQGFDPATVELPPAPAETPQKLAARPPAPVELEPRIATDKGTLFLGASEVQARERGDTSEDAARVPTSDQQSAGKEIPSTVVKGPAQPPPTPAPSRGAPERQADEEPRMFDRILQDADNLGKLLNPFRW